MTSADFPLFRRAQAMGVLDGGSALIVAPTGTGKSYIGRQVVLRALARGAPGVHAYLVPFRALASETYESFLDELAERGARVRLVGPQGERVVPLEDLYRDDGMFFLEKGQAELVAQVLLPPTDGTLSTYWKLRRRGAFDCPVLGVAVALRLAQDGSIAWARLAVTGVASRPLLMEEAAALLVGRRPEPELWEAVARAVYLPLRPLDNTDYPHYYRKRMAAVYVRRALAELTGVA